MVGHWSLSGMSIPQYAESSCSFYYAGESGVPVVSYVEHNMEVMYTCAI